MTRCCLFRFPDTEIAAESETTKSLKHLRMYHPAIYCISSFAMFYLSLLSSEITTVYNHANSFADQAYAALKSKKTILLCRTDAQKDTLT